MAQVDVELKHVVKEFPTRAADINLRAVDDISLQIYEGEFFALLGPSGCGKTTTLRMIAGFEDTSSGQILIRGNAVQDVPPFHRPVNTVFQDYALFPHMTVLQNVMFGLEMEGVRKDEAKARAIEALEMVRLVEFDRKPRQLSGGQQQRVAIARSLAMKPKVMLFDEVASGLDPELTYEVLRTMEQLAASGMTSVLVTHEMNFARRIADTVAFMHNGKLHEMGPAAELFENPKTSELASFLSQLI